MSVALDRPATYADLEAVHPQLVAELLGGELVTHPRPVPKHGAATSLLSATLAPPFSLRRGGPGGWIFVDEPELHLGGDVVVPDLAAWRRERLPKLPDTAYIATAPDWVCEVTSPSTERYDRGIKRRIYAGAGVEHLWLLDPRAELLETFSLAGAQWLLTGVFAGAEPVSAPPFDAIAFPLDVLWPFGSDGGKNPAEPTTK